MIKYVVAYKVPAYAERVVRDNYFRVTGRDVSFSNFHISLLHPFTLHETHSEGWILQQIEWMGFSSISAWVTNIDVFIQKKKTLLINVEPKDEMNKVHFKLTSGLRKGMAIDTRSFIDGELPAFSPHISLDYDFDGDALTLSSLQLERFEAHFDTGIPRLYKYGKSLTFQEVLQG